MNPSDLANIYH